MGAAQAASRVELRREGERWAWKKEALFWSRRETGMQERKVVLERKLVKKVGQVVEVKLLPREVSKGLGRGVVITVVEGAVARPVVVVALVDAVADEEGIETVLEADSVGTEEAEDVEVEVAEELVEDDVSCPTCLLWSSATGSGLVSKCISPRSWNSRN